ncbi:MAG TPA: hypothetical protein VL651_16370, partial [Bacteroidia bacterium]|nr:hypothetical protein [Bacteroidia bacterium]
MEFQEKLQIASADFNRHFEFLVSEFGYSAVEKSYTLSGGVNMVHVFRNELAEKQIEIAGNLSWFHTEIRRLLKAKPADYDDNENCIGYESLAILESNGDYDHWKYFVPFAGWENVINNTISLFLRNKTLLTSKNWVDNALLKKVKRESFFKLTGLYPDDTSDLHELLIRKVVEW